MRYFSRFYKGRQDTITILNRNPLNLYRGPTPLSQHQTIEGAVRAAYRDARQNGNATYRVRVDGGNYVRFSITLPDRGAIQASTQVGLDVALVLGAPWQPPVVSSTPTPSFTEGTPGTYEFEANITRTGLPVGFDYPITYTLNGTVDPSLSLAAATGVLTYDGSAGTTYALTLTVTDAQGADTSDSFDMTIVAIDTAPTVSTPSFSAFTEGVFGQTRDLSVYVTDDGQSPVVYSITGALPGGVTLDSATGILSYNGIALADTRSVTFTATDDVGSDTSSSFNITIAEAAVGAEADFAARIAQPGVVWHHNFQSEAEVDAFRWGGFGNDPGNLSVKANSCFLDQTDGITGGGCLQLLHKISTQEPHAWWRPMSALASPGNGRTEDDPGANGTIAVKTWSPVQGTPVSQSTTTLDWVGGAYGNSTYHDSRPGIFDGTEFYYQVRAKMDVRRSDPANPGGGKIFYFSRTDTTLTTQEIVTESGNRRSVGVNYFHMYPGSGSMGSGSDNQPGSDYGFCDWLPGDAREEPYPGCWAWSNGWDTLLYHVRPGLNSNSDTIVRVWVAKPGETAYTKIWDVDDLDLGFSVFEGHNAVIASCYQNTSTQGAPATELYHKYDEMIFSKDPIICPQTTPTALEERTRVLPDGDFFLSNDAGSPVIPNYTHPSPSTTTTWQCHSGWYDPIRRRAHFMDSGHEEAYVHGYLDEIDNTWTEVNMSQFGTGSHFRGHTFDRDTGRIFWQKEASGGSVRWYNPDTDTWASHSTILSPGDPGSTPFVVGFHPNLFGPGKPGLIHCGPYWTQAFQFTDYRADPTAGSWIKLNASAYPTGTGTLSNHGWRGQAFYLPDRDELIVTWTWRGVGKTGTPNVLAIDAGAGLLAGSFGLGNGCEYRTSPPKPIANDAGGADKMYGCIHPNRPNSIIAMDGNNPTPTLISDDGGQTWDTAPYACPFTDELDGIGNMTVTSLPYHGVIMGIDSDGANNIRFCFWNPGP